jgi:hypothetical protein
MMRFILWRGWKFTAALGIGFVGSFIGIDLASTTTQAWIAGASTQVLLQIYFNNID